MKQKIIKIIYFIILFIGIFIGIYLVIKPINNDIEHAVYDNNEKISINTFSNEVKQKIYIKDDKTYRLLFFLNSNIEYDNFIVKLIDENNNEVFNNHIESYQSHAMYFEFPFIEKDKFYTLVITDLDNDNIELPVVNGSNKSFIEDNEDITMQLITYSKKASYSYLWYPLFMFVFLFTIYPFVFGGKNEKKIIK